ncbi:MAG: sigma 54-interacting transcriptional regulator, partial [Bacteroidota bacterium]
ATLFESELFGHEKGAFTGATEVRKGKFELAHDGTLFLDEVSAMPLELLPKLLRVLEERTLNRVGSSVQIKVDVRLIAASNKDLLQAVRAGEFREDLYHRLNVVPILIPTLSDRVEDIPLLAKVFLGDFSHQTKRFAHDALELLSKMNWRGNVRELRNIVERISIFISSSEITAAHINTLGIGNDAHTSEELTTVLRALIRSNNANIDLLDTVEKQLIELALKETGGNVSKASQLVGIDRNALQRRIEKFGLGKSSGVRE